MTKYLIVILTFLFFKSFSQDLGLVKNIAARHFQLKTTKDTIDFVLINGNIDTIKPVLIFCQGSKPMPLITIELNGNKFFTLMTNFDYKKISKNYHLILSKDYCFITDTSNQQSYSTMYLKNNYADNYIRRTKDVINYLYKQKWVRPNKIILFGHSQGSTVAVGASLNNAKVYKVGYASGNPLGRIDQLVRERRKLINDGKLTQEEGQSQIESIYEMWRQINESPNAITTEFGDPNKTWTSFSIPNIDNLLNLKQPLYVVYGTADITSSFCDLLPIYFIRSHKNNLTLKPYTGLEHNFFDIDKNGRPIYTKGHWQEVMNDFIKWTEQ
jgi:hypothetical protein